MAVCVASLIPSHQLLHLAHAGQAFVEFPSPEAALAAEMHYSGVSAALRGREPKISVSTQNPTIEKGHIINLGPNGFVPPNAELEKAGPPSRVVVLNIFNSQQTPVTLDAVHSLTSYIGPVVRIVLFEKDGRTNALVQFRDLDTAIKAQRVLSRHHLWNNQTGLILTSFGKQNEISLPGGSNSARGCDYSAGALQPSIFADPAAIGAAATVTGNAPAGYGDPVALQQRQQQAAMAFMQQQHQQQQQQQQQQPQQQQHQHLPPFLYSGQQQPQQQPAYQTQAMQPHQLPGIHQQQQQELRVAAAPPAPSGGRCVVMVCGAPKSEDNVIHVYNLMSFWGNIRAIKFLSKKENVAAVEYTSAEEAQNALNWCKGASVMGVPIQVTGSHFASVQISGTEANAKDFSDDRSRRYAHDRPTQQYQTLMCPPSPKLHVANLHNYTEAAIRNLFSSFGTVVAINFMPDAPTLGFVTMSTAAEACCAICKLHGHLNPYDPAQRPLKVAFARK